MSKTVDDSGDQPGEEDAKLEVCYGCQVWCECHDGSGITEWGTYCDCVYVGHSCGKDE